MDKKKEVTGKTRALSTLCWLLGAFAVWEITALILKYLFRDPMADKRLPELLSVLQTFVEYGEIILRQAGVTLSYAAAGFLIGSAAGALLAVLMRLSRIAEKTILPYLLASQMIPILGLAPIVMGLVKDIDAARIAISAFITFFPVSMSLLAGMKSVETNYLDLMRISSCRTFDLYRKLLLPWALPSLFAGFKIAAPVAVSAAILVDTLSARNGIGYIIIYTLYGGGTKGQFWPALLVAALMGVLSFLLISLAETVLLKRRRGVKKRGMEQKEHRSDPAAGRSRDPSYRDAAASMDP